MSDNMYPSAKTLEAKELDRLNKMREEDKEKGLDIDSMESILNFDPGYTPLSNAVLVKEISEIHKYGSIILPESATDNLKKCVIIAIGVIVTAIVKKGDIATYMPNPDNIDMKRVKVPITLKGIEFFLIPYNVLGGVHVSPTVIKERQRELDREYNAINKSW